MDRSGDSASNRTRGSSLYPGNVVIQPILFLKPTDDRVEKEFRPRNSPPAAGPISYILLSAAVRSLGSMLIHGEQSAPTILISAAAQTPMHSTPWTPRTSSPCYMPES